MTISIQYPGVYVQEVASRMHPIEGVSTSTTGLVHVQEMAAHAHPIDGVHTRVHTPEWTDPRPGDPGVTLIDLFAFLGESLAYRTGLVPERNTGALLQLLEQSARESNDSASIHHEP